LIQNKALDDGNYEMFQRAMQIEREKVGELLDK
jgi:hypothetical protein